MPVTATALIRKMRGGAQAHLLECDDGHFYVVKFQNNPQHRRILFNEWLASSLLAHLQISTPEITIVSISAEFLARHPEVHIQLRAGRLAVKPGQHFGSRYQGQSPMAIVYDFVPEVLFDQVVNRNEFLGALVLDKWTGNSDARQAIFTRPDITGILPSHRIARGFLVSMIDQGYAFGGHLWKFMDSPLQGLYFRPSVYHHVRSWDDFQPWLDRVVNFPKEVLDRTRRQIPLEWIFGDEEAMDLLLGKLILRCKRVPDLIAESVRGRVNPFPEWTEAKRASRYAPIRSKKIEG
jgi:hypothetical protein